MNKQFATKHISRRTITHILSFVIGLALVLPVSGKAYAQEAPDPIIRISTSNNYLEADYFTPGAMVYFTVYATSEPSSEKILEISGQPDENGIVFIDGSQHTADLVPGNYVVATDGIIEKQVLLEPLTIEVYDPETDIVAGTAQPGRNVWIVIGNATVNPGGKWATADADGKWIADFTGEFDIPSEGMWGSAVLYDEDADTTVYHKGQDIPAPNPHFTIFPEWNWFDGMDWPNWSVNITVEGKPECAVKKVSPGGFFNGGFPEGCDVTAGDVVTFADGITTRMHTVRNLAITKVSEEDDNVSGTSDKGAILTVWSYDYTGDALKVKVGGSNKWVADFSDLFDMVSNTAGRAQIYDQYGNATSVEWRVPNPHFTIFPEWDWYDGMDWPDGASVSIQVADKPVCTTEQVSWGGFFNGGFPEGCDVTAGDTLTFKYRDTIRTHTVRNLAITGVNAVTDGVTGTADEGAVVNVWPYDYYGEGIQAISGSGGIWQADFKGISDIVPNDCGRAEIYDEQGNRTSVEWCFVQETWRDEFDGSLSDVWYWNNENPEKWNLNEQPGFLRIYNSSSPTGGENLLLRPVVQHDFVIKTHLAFTPENDFQFAGLVLYQDDNNFIQFGRAFCDIGSSCVGNGLYFDKILGGGFDTNFATQIDSPSDVYLRLERRWDMVKAFYSFDGGWSWYLIGTHWLPEGFQVNAVGLTSSQDYTEPYSGIAADFDYFELTDGWGFLPDGFHDYDQGEVPSWNCNAGGWAMDPDDYAARVNVEVVVDDQSIVTLVAQDFRQDLLDAEVCEGGSCGFSTFLWEAISHDQPHNVDTWAQDTLTGEWVLLNSSDKTLTCLSTS